MKRMAVVLSLVALLSVPPLARADMSRVPNSGTARHADEYDELESHPLRIAAYLLHPVGFALEWLVARPLHALVSQPGLDKVFGHRPHED
ncbi:MAG: hypothetical protein KatS3mg076_1014 [Candidatus Binatia bacterium]|nr:MAG: hypothetical protein KatS3mg076_1014 [Candidatus Binatia bacterium]